MVNDITTNEKLQELDSIQGEKENQQTSPVPLILKQTSTGLVCHGENRGILQQLIWTRAVRMLKDRGICLRNGVLFDWRKRRYLDSLPKAAYDKCLEKHDYIIANKVVGKKQSYEYTPVRSGSLVQVAHYLPAPQLKRKVEESLCLPEIVFENELTGDDEDEGIYTPAISARVDAETKEYARDLFSSWIVWMERNAKDQLDFFKQITRGFLFANRFDVEHEPKINFGVGPNRAGKGTLITFLECIPNLGDFAVWQPTDCASEYRHASIFKERVTLSVCHEWRDLPKQDNFIALIKQAVRREALTVRDVGTKTRQIVCPSEFVIFFNSSHGDNRERALGESYEMLAKWDAYDRMNVVFVDWSRRFDRFAEFDRLLRKKAGRDAIGLAVYDWAKTLVDDFPQVYPIPTSVADSRSEASLAKWERALIGIVEVLVEVRDLVSERRGSLVSLSEYRDDANLLARRRMRQILKRESSDSFVLSERNDEIFWGVNAKWLTAALKQFGAPTRWKVPANLSNVLDKSISEQVNIKGNGWNVVFDLDEASRIGL